MTHLRITAIVGSLRKESINKKLIQAIAAQAPTGIDFQIADIDLPLYNQDREADTPFPADALKLSIQQADALIIATPEYNRSMPAVLKNAIDWASRPYGKSAWNDKIVAVVGASPGILGTALAQYHLKQCLLHLNCRVLGQPEFMLSNAGQKFEGSKLIDDSSKKAIDALWNALLAAIKRG